MGREITRPLGQIHQQQRPQPDPKQRQRPQINAEYVAQAGKPDNKAWPCRIGRGNRLLWLHTASRLNIDGVLRIIVGSKSKADVSKVLRHYL